MGLGKGKNKILTTLFHLFLFPSQGFWVCLLEWFSCFMEKEKGGKKRDSVTGWVTMSQLCRQIPFTNCKRQWVTMCDKPRQHIKKQTLLCWQKSIQSKLWFFQLSHMNASVGPSRRLSAKKLMLLNCGVREDPWESLGLQGDPTSPS